MVPSVIGFITLVVVLWIMQSVGEDSVALCFLILVGSLTFVLYLHWQLSRSEKWEAAGGWAIGCLVYAALHSCADWLEVTGRKRLDGWQMLKEESGVVTLGCCMFICIVVALLCIY